MHIGNVRTISYDTTYANDSSSAIFVRASAWGKLVRGHRLDKHHPGSTSVLEVVIGTNELFHIENKSISHMLPMVDSQLWKLRRALHTFLEKGIGRCLLWVLTETRGRHYRHAFQIYDFGLACISCQDETCDLRSCGVSGRRPAPCLACN